MVSDSCTDSAGVFKKCPCAAWRIVNYITFAIITLSAAVSSDASGNQDFISPDAVLWRAVARNDSTGVLAALKAGAYVDSKQVPGDLRDRYYVAEGHTPFFETIIRKNNDLALLLLEHGADPMSRTPRGITPVQAVIDMGDEQMFDALLAKGADIRSELKWSDNPQQLRMIDLAAWGGSLKIMNAVLAAGHALPDDRQGQIKILTNALPGTPQMFEYLVRETGIELSPEIISGFVEKALQLRSEKFLCYSLQKGYLADSSLEKILMLSLRDQLDSLAADLLDSHPQLRKKDMAEAFAQRLRKGDPRPLADLLIRFDREDVLLPHLNELFLYCGKMGDAEWIRSFLEKLRPEKSRESELRGFALLGAVKGEYLERRWWQPGQDDVKMRAFADLTKKLLRQPQLDVTVSDEDGLTSLWYAVQNANVELVRELLAKGAKASSDSSGSWSTPGFLYSACELRLNGLVSELVAAGAELEATDDYDVTALGCAVAKKNVPLARELLAAGADPNHFVAGRPPTKVNPFLGAVSGGNAEMVAVFLQPRSPRKVSPEWLRKGLLTAIADGQVDIVERILSVTKDVNRPITDLGYPLDKPPIIHAVEANQPEMVRFLLKQGAMLVSEGYTEKDLLCYSVNRQGLEMTRVLLDAGLHADISCEEVPLLSIAVADGDPGQIELLLERGANVDAPVSAGDFKGWTPLLFAVSANKQEVFSLLVNRGAATDVIAPSLIEDNGWLEKKPDTMSPLMKAAEKGQVDIIKTLVRAGADIDLANAEGYTALMTAARFGQVEAVRTLLLLGADSTLVNKRSFGALWLSTLSGVTGVQRLLLGMTGMTERDEALVIAARLGEFEHLDNLLRKGVVSQRVLDRALSAAIRANAENAPCRDLTMLEDEGRARLKSIRALVAAGGDPDTGSLGTTLYYTLINSGYAAGWQKQVALLLNDLGADINRPILNSATTPLIDAVRMDNSEMTALFLKLGADPCLRDKRGSAAIDWVKRDPENKTRQALLKGGAQQCKN